MRKRKSPPGNLAAHFFSSLSLPIFASAGLIWLAICRDIAIVHRPSLAAAVSLVAYVAMVLFSLWMAERSTATTESIRRLYRLRGSTVPVCLVAILAAGLPTVRFGVDWGHVALALPASAAVALVEEFAFRAVLFAIWEERLGTAGAVIGTSATFVAAHAALYPPRILLVGATLSLLFALWRVIRQDLVIPTVVHAVLDALAAGALGG